MTYQKHDKHYGDDLEKIMEELTEAERVRNMLLNAAIDNVITNRP